MKFGIHGPATVSRIDRIVRAEQLGYDAVYFGDSPIIYSDVFATMALAAQATKKMTIGTGIAVAGLRMPQTVAAGFATINKLAPGRVIAGLGTGHTGYTLIGQESPVSQADFREFVRVVKGLMAGEEVEFTFNGETKPIKFLMPDLGFIDVEHKIPIYLAAMGPKGQQLAGELADGIFDSWGPMAALPALKENLRTGAARSGRSLDGFQIAGENCIIVLEPGEDLTSDRVIEEAGQAICILLHSFYHKFGRAPLDKVPPFVAPCWDERCTMMEKWGDPRTAHFRKFADHGWFIPSEERKFIRPELIQIFFTVGRPEEIIDKIRQWERDGATFINLFATDASMDRKMEQFAKLVMSKL